MNYLKDGLNYVGAIPSQYPTTAITKTAFRNRFTFAERVAIKTAQSSDVMLQVLADDQANATYIDLSRADTSAGLDLLFSKGLIASDRKSEILTVEISESERPL